MIAEINNRKPFKKVMRICVTKKQETPEEKIIKMDFFEEKEKKPVEIVTTK